jgi:hypothetical protein
MAPRDINRVVGPMGLVGGDGGHGGRRRLQMRPRTGPLGAVCPPWPVSFIPVSFIPVSFIPVSFIPVCFIMLSFIMLSFIDYHR